MTSVLIYIISITLGPKNGSLLPNCLYFLLFISYLRHQNLTLTFIGKRYISLFIFLYLYLHTHIDIYKESIQVTLQDPSLCGVFVLGLDNGSTPEEL